MSNVSKQNRVISMDDIAGKINEYEDETGAIDATILVFPDGRCIIRGLNGKATESNDFVGFILD